MYKYAHFSLLTAKELHNVLVEKGYRPIERDKIMVEVAEYKETQRMEKVRKAKLDSLWRELIEPLSNEMRTVYNMKRYAAQGYPVKERAKALEVYSEVLAKLNRKLRGYWATYRATPIETALSKKIPNKGEHWTDWVPDSIRSAVADLFNDIPHGFKAKAKTPFERKIDKKTNSKKKSSLIRAIKTERGRTERDIAVLNDLLKGESNADLDKLRELLSDLEAALKAVLEAPDDAPMPHVWHSLVNKTGSA